MSIERAPGVPFRKVHFLGICGTAMGAVAAALRDRGIEVTGQDERAYPPMSDFLARKGVPVTEGFGPDGLPTDADLVVVGNAMTRGNPAVEALLNRKLAYLSLPETLRLFFLRGRHNLVVTGTHGKTTTSSLLAWIFESAGLAPAWLIGGLPENLGAGANLRDSKHFILEGDEYDTAFFDKRSKFLHYLPELVIINNIEFDHADIFRDLAEIKASFRNLLRIVPSVGMVLINADDPACVEVAMGCPAPVLEVGFSENAGVRIREVRGLGSGRTAFELAGENYELPLSGQFNVRNAAMAASAARFYGIPPDEIRKAFSQFRGIKRRQEILGTPGGVTIVDDFGHHPTALRETLAALRERHPGSRLWAIFEPRSNTMRRNVFQHALPGALSLADGVVLGAVARSEQIAEAERLDPQRVAMDLEALGRRACYEPDTQGIVERVVKWASPGDVIVVFSNGGFDGLHGKLLRAFESPRS